MTLFVYKSNCSTCREAKKILDTKDLAYTARDLNKAPLSVPELSKIIGEKDIEPFVNTRTALYREKEMKQHPPSKKQMMEWMAQEPNLIKRPLLIHQQKYTHGLDRDYYEAL